MFFHSSKFYHHAHVLPSDKRTKSRSSSIDSLLLDDDNALRKTSLDEYMQAIQFFSNDIVDPSNQIDNTGMSLNKLVFSEKVAENVRTNYFSFVYKGLQYIKHCLKEPMQKSLAHKLVNLGDNQSLHYFFCNQIIFLQKPRRQSSLIWMKL